jgi:L-lactate dehydrogenase complex protein LldG
MSSRDTILSKIRSALGTTGAVPVHPPAPLLPARASVTGDAAIKDFTAHLEAQGVIVLRAASPQGTARAVGLFAGSCHPGEPLAAGLDPWLASVAWSDAGVIVGPWLPDAVPVIGLSRAAAGIAETGTLVLVSGPDNPATLNYLPETHVVVIAADTISGSTEEAFAKARSSLPTGGMPRTLALVSGASRTADVGGKLVRGAHGPKRLAVIIVGGVAKSRMFG